VSFVPRFTITNAIALDLTMIERARGFLEAARLSDEWVEAMRVRALVLEAHHTTHIEGTQLTLEQSERLLRGEPVPEALPDDARELLNYRDAFDLVSEALAGGQPVTKALVREIHKRLVSGVRGDSAAPGEYRRVQNQVHLVIINYTNSASRNRVSCRLAGSLRACPRPRGPPPVGARRSEDAERRCASLRVGAGGPARRISGAAPRHSASRAKISRPSRARSYDEVYYVVNSRTGQVIYTPPPAFDL